MELNNNLNMLYHLIDTDVWSQFDKAKDLLKVTFNTQAPTQPVVTDQFKEVFKWIFENVIIEKYKNFVVLNPEKLTNDLLRILLDKGYCIINKLIRIYIDFSDYKLNFDNYFNKSKNEIAAATGYAGYNVEGDFQKNKSTGTSTSGNEYIFIQTMTLASDEFMLLERELLKLVQTIY